MGKLLDQFSDLDVWLAADYSQLEIRVLGQFSQDKLLIQLLQSGEDIHSAVGHVLTGIPIEKIKHNREVRTAIKGLHFGLIYGLTPGSLFMKLKIEAAERKEKFDMTLEGVSKMYDGYYTRFSGVKTWLDGQVDFAQEHGYVMTLFGLPREISPFGDDERTSFWGNQSRNSAIQGTAHQLLLIAMAVLEIKQQTYKLLQRLSMEVHDSLYAYSKVINLVQTYKLMMHLLEKEVLEYVKKWWPKIDWNVPLKAEAKAGFRLGVMMDYQGEEPEEFLSSWCEKNLKFETGLSKQLADFANEQAAAKTV